MLSHTIIEVMVTGIGSVPRFSFRNSDGNLGNDPIGAFDPRVDFGRQPDSGSRIPQQVRPSDS